MKKLIILCAVMFPLLASAQPFPPPWSSLQVLSNLMLRSPNFSNFFVANSNLLNQAVRQGLGGTFANSPHIDLTKPGNFFSSSTNFTSSLLSADLPNIGLYRVVILNTSTNSITNFLPKSFSAIGSSNTLSSSLVIPGLTRFELWLRTDAATNWSSIEFGADNPYLADIVNGVAAATTNQFITKLASGRLGFTTVSGGDVSNAAALTLNQPLVGAGNGGVQVMTDPADFRSRIGAPGLTNSENQFNGQQNILDITGGGRSAMTLGSSNVADKSTLIITDVGNGIPGITILDAAQQNELTFGLSQQSGSYFGRNFFLQTNPRPPPGGGGFIPTNTASFGISSQTFSNQALAVWDYIFFNNTNGDTIIYKNRATGVDQNAGGMASGPEAIHVDGTRGVLSLGISSTNGFTGPGTASVSGSTVTGTGTTFTNLAFGDRLFWGGTSATIKSILNNTNLTLFEQMGTIADGVYTIQKPTLSLFGLATSPLSVIDSGGAFDFSPATGFVWRAGRWGLQLGGSGELNFQDMVNNSNPLTINAAGEVIIADEAYDATGWNGDLSVPTKNALRDKIETLSGGSTFVGNPNQFSETNIISGSLQTNNSLFSGDVLSIDVANRELENNLGAVTLDWQNSQLFKVGGVPVYSWGFGNHFKTSIGVGIAPSSTDGQVTATNALVVAGNPTGAALVINTNQLVVTNGNVGIGTKTPGNNLEINIGTGNTLFKGLTISQGSGYFKVINGTSVANSFVGGFESKGTISGNATSILFVGLAGSDADTAGNIYNFSARNVSGTGVVGNSQKAYSFQNYTTELLTMLGSGSVGIGTNAPAAKLHVVGNVIASAFSENGVNFTKSPTNAQTANFVQTASGDGSNTFWGAAGAGDVLLSANNHFTGDSNRFNRVYAPTNTANFNFTTNWYGTTLGTRVANGNRRATLMLSLAMVQGATGMPRATVKIEQLGAGGGLTNTFKLETVPGASISLTNTWNLGKLNPNAVVIITDASTTLSSITVQDSTLEAE